MSLEQELPTLPDNLSSPPIFSGVGVTRSLVLYVCFVDRCLSFCTFFFWPLCCQFFFDLRILIIFKTTIIIHYKILVEKQLSLLIKVITKLPNSEQSYKGKVKTHNYINRQNQSTTGKLWTETMFVLIQWWNRNYLPFRGSWVHLWLLCCSLFIFLYSKYFVNYCLCFCPGSFDHFAMSILLYLKAFLDFPSKWGWNK